MSAISERGITMKVPSFHFNRLFILGLIVNLSLFSLAKWSEPVLLGELNDLTEVQPATEPGISADGLSLLFTRQIPSKGGYYVIEAARETTESAFLDQTVLTNLGKKPGGYIANPRLSQDGLRLYYVEARVYQSKYQNLICMASRQTVQDNWSLSRIHTELHSIERDSSPSLTADELTIMWMESDPDVTTETAVYMATRSSISSPFGNIRKVEELTEIQALDPFMSSNGLSVYFVLMNPEGYYQLWKGTRESFDMPFSDFEPLEDINQSDMNFRHPCCLPDESAIYFFCGAPWLNQTYKGICVSYWVSDPYLVALMNLYEAKELKEKAKESIDKAIEREMEAAKALASIQKNDLPEGISPKDIRLARTNILHALQRQIIARMNLRASLEFINKALLRIELPETEVEQAAQADEKSAKSATPISKAVDSKTVKK